MTSLFYDFRVFQFRPNVVNSSKSTQKVLINFRVFSMYSSTSTSTFTFLTKILEYEYWVLLKVLSTKSTQYSSTSSTEYFWSQLCHTLWHIMIHNVIVFCYTHMISEMVSLSTKLRIFWFLTFFSKR